MAETATKSAENLPVTGNKPTRVRTFENWTSESGVTYRKATDGPKWRKTIIEFMESEGVFFDQPVRLSKLSQVPYITFKREDGQGTTVVYFSINSRELIGNGELPSNKTFALYGMVSDADYTLPGGEIVPSGSHYQVFGLAGEARPRLMPTDAD